MLKLFSFFKKKENQMSKYILVILLLAINACTTTNVSTTQPISSTVPQVTVRPAASLADTKVNHAQTQSPKVSYDPKVADYINQNQSAQILKTAAPEFASKTLAPHCTVEKFVSGLNSSQTEITKTSASTIEIKTFGTKIGNGNIKITAHGKNAEISSAVIGKFKRTDTNILRKFAQNICNAVDEKLK